MSSDSNLIRLSSLGTIPADFLLSPWVKHHLYMLGLDKIKLFAYQKLSGITVHSGGGTLKNAVFDLSVFVKRELSINAKLLHEVKHHLYFEPNNSAPSLLSIRGDSRWFYIVVGYLMLKELDLQVKNLTDKVVDLYLELGGGFGDSLNVPLGNTEKQILKLASKFYRSVKIDYKALYAPTDVKHRTITFGDDLPILIQLPPLPQIKSKHLLAKALLHKELYRAIFLPGHTFRELLTERDITIDDLALTVVRYDLLFLDGLGDFFIATEASEFLYKFRALHPYSADTSFGKKTYTLLKTILGTNTLLLRLANAYNLHVALKDDVVLRELHESYIPHISGHLSPPDAQTARYEEEFLADFFEQYVGALYLEQPEVAKAWLSELFQNILFLITDTYKVKHKKKKCKLNFHYDYRAWSVDVIGRSI